MTKPTVSKHRRKPVGLSDKAWIPPGPRRERREKNRKGERKHSWIWISSYGLDTTWRTVTCILVLQRMPVLLLMFTKCQSLTVLWVLLLHEWNTLCRLVCWHSHRNILYTHCSQRTHLHARKSWMRALSYSYVCRSSACWCRPSFIECAWETPAVITALALTVYGCCKIIS